MFTLGSQTRLWRSGARDQGGEGEIVGIDSVASWDEELSPVPAMLLMTRHNTALSIHILHHSPTPPRPVLC